MIRYPSRQSILQISVITLIVCLALSCAVRRPIVGTPTAGPSSTLAPSVFYEEGSLAFFSVNAALARFDLERDLLPLEIAVANKDLPQLTVAPELLTLRDRESGQLWSPATPKEPVGTSLRSSFNRNLMPVPFEDIVSLRFQAYTRVRAGGLREGNPVLTRKVELGRSSWMLAQVWFPNPGGDLSGKTFDVELDAPELPDPIYVTIRF